MEENQNKHRLPQLLVIDFATPRGNLLIASSYIMCLGEVTNHKQSELYLYIVEVISYFDNLTSNLI
jgi:hypothetical protein